MAGGIFLRSIWQETTTPPQGRRLCGTVKADVAVIGAGLVGILLADRLQAAGKTVAVVEAGEIGGGQSGRTTAKVTTLLSKAHPETGRGAGACHRAKPTARRAGICGDDRAAAAARGLGDLPQLSVHRRRSRAAAGGMCGSTEIGICGDLHKGHRSADQGERRCVF